MTRRMNEWSDNPIFHYRTRLGFEIGPHASQQVHFVFWRKETAPHDWQLRDSLVDLRIPGGAPIYQDMEDNEWELETGAWFRGRADYRKFLALSRFPGLLRMNADYTVHRDDSRPLDRQVVPILGRRYAEFDSVTVHGITDQSVDNDGGVRCQVVYRRPYVAQPVIEPQPYPEAPWPYTFGFGEGPFGLEPFGNDSEDV